MNELQIEIAQVAARLIAEEGWPWSGAKQRALDTALKLVA